MIWDDLKIYEAVALAADVLGVEPHRATVSTRGDLVVVCFCDSSGSVLGTYTVNEAGEVAEE
jgi:hypothetical protein